MRTSSTAKLALCCAMLHCACARAAPPAVVMATAAALEHGEGMPRDLPRAAELYCRLARQGVADAQYALGWMIINGRGGPRDEGVARRLFELAAAQGHEQAARLVAALPASVQAPLPACMEPDPPLQLELAPDPWAALPAAIPPQHNPVRQLVETLAPQYDVDPQLALAVIAVESGFRVHAVSPKNAQGLMQLIPQTARRFAVADPFDPESNVRGGACLSAHAAEVVRWRCGTRDGGIQRWRSGGIALPRRTAVP